ncbi:protein PAXX isoform 1-T1 [Dugong dugon]
MVPPPLSPPLCTLPAGPGPPRFVCYCEEDGARGSFNLYVTDAAELWSTCFSPDNLPALKARFGLSAAEDITPRFRAACERQGVTLTLQEDIASLMLSGGPWTLTFDLSKLPRRQLPAPRRAPRGRGLSSFYQTPILRGVALDLGSGDGALGSPSSIRASRGTCPPRLRPAPGPGLGLPCTPPRNGTLSLLFPVRNRPVVWTLTTPEGTAKSVTRPGIRLEGRDSPLETPFHLPTPVTATVLLPAHQAVSQAPPPPNKRSPGGAVVERLAANQKVSSSNPPAASWKPYRAVPLCA